MHFEIHRARRFVAGILAAFAMLPSAGAQTPLHCEIAIDFSIDGKPVASPTAIVDFGKEAEITLGNPDEHAWRFVILADEPAIVHRVSAIPVRVELYEIGEGKSFLRASPHVNVVPGQRAEIETIFADDDGRHAHIALVAYLRSDADVEAISNGANDPPR